MDFVNDCVREEMEALGEKVSLGLRGTGCQLPLVCALSLPPRWGTVDAPLEGAQGYQWFPLSKPVVGWNIILHSRGSDNLHMPVNHLFLNSGTFYY